MQFAFASFYLSRVISFFKICFCSFHFDSVSFHFRFEKIVSRSRANHIIWRALKELDLLSFASRATLPLFSWIITRRCKIKHAIRQLLLRGNKYLLNWNFTFCRLSDLVQSIIYLSLQQRLFKNYRRNEQKIWLLWWQDRWKSSCDWRQSGNNISLRRRDWARRISAIFYPGFIVLVFKW